MLGNLTTDNIVGASIVGGLAVIGLCTNGAAIFILFLSGKISQSFQQLCLSHCIANMVALSFFLLYCTPMIIMQSLFSSSTITGKLIGGFMVAIWDVSVYSHLISSINRLLVLCFPIASRNLLTQRNTIIMIAIVWFLGFLHFIPYLKVHDCYIVFSSNNYLWSFAPTTCGFVLGKVLDFGTGVTVFGLILLFDIFTIYRIRKLLMVAKRKIHPSEVKFFLQSCLQFGAFVVKLTCFYFISGFFTNIEVNHWELFFTTSFAWEFTHCIDGVILIPFHYKEYLNARRGNYMGKSFASSVAQRSRIELSKTAISHSHIDKAT